MLLQAIFCDFSVIICHKFWPLKGRRTWCQVSYSHRRDDRRISLSLLAVRSCWHSNIRPVNSATFERVPAKTGRYITQIAIVVATIC